MGGLKLGGGGFSQTLQFQCNARLLSWYVVCLSSVVTRVDCDKTADRRITQFHWTVAQCLSSSSAKFDDEIRTGSPWSVGYKLGWGGVRLRYAISRKRCKIELRWQLITNRKSLLYRHFDCNKIWWPWTSICCCVISVLRVVTKWLMLESRGFRYKVVYFNYEHIKFDDEIKGDTFEFQA